MKIEFIQKIIDKIRKKNHYKPFCNDNYYINFDRKPMYENQYKANIDSFSEKKILTIVMQGPIVYKNNFTLETIKLYKKTFCNCPIILSTWDYEDNKVIEDIKKLGVTVIKNTLPEHKGLGNVNYQIKSTKEGLKKAKELGASYVIKTRTDQRFYETHIVEYLFNLMQLYPKDAQSIKQKERLITLSFNTFKYRLYDITDMFLFGHIDDVIEYWNCYYEEREIFPQWNTLLDFCKIEPCEIGICIQYLKKIGHVPNFTLKDSWECYSKYFCIIDASSIRLYWPKYTNDAFRFRNFVGKDPFLEELTYKEWLSLYLKNKKIIPEEILNQKY